MARPSTHGDLSEHQRKPVTIASAYLSTLVQYPTLGQHFVAALIEAGRLGLTVTDDGEIQRPRTDAELDNTLRSAQATWDDGKADYEAALAGATPTYRYRIEAYCKAEGLEIPAKPEPVEVTR
ncbi:hypothetical protein QUV83_16200 [Cellulomonas cellasea]|uniref:DUF7432 family protein n=1 Tax=Cellulomonas cellasea TaxID=43670 RepID=UPI0025A3A1B7|nr:hypothetical protein [Cellulomonas cellasea]MDM8086317.1 hypothetical protein [Cellulomonas cellasea]